MTAVSDFIANLQGNRFAKDSSPMIGDIDLFVAALEELAAGGGGSPGGPATSVQTNDGAGGFIGFNTLTYDGTSFGLVTTDVFIQGTNQIQLEAANMLSLQSNTLTSLASGGDIDIFADNVGNVTITSVGGFIQLTTPSLNANITNSCQIEADSFEFNGLSGASIQFSTNVNIGTSAGSVNVTASSIISLNAAIQTLVFNQLNCLDGILGAGPLTVGTLIAPTAGAGFAVVTDALAPIAGQVIVGGGAVITPLYYDGTDWRALVTI